MGRKLALLDRDGTLNVDHGYVSRWEDLQFVEGAIEALELLQKARFELVIVSNQSGIARGLFGRNDVERLHAQMIRVLAEAGIDLAAVLYCPHGPEEGCLCRKPQTGMIDAWLEASPAPVDWAASWTFGDKPSDMAFGRALGTRTALLESRYWSHGLADLVAVNLLEAVRGIF